MTDDHTNKADQEQERRLRLTAGLVAVACVLGVVASVDAAILGVLALRAYVLTTAIMPGLAIALACAGLGDLLVRNAATSLTKSERVVFAFAGGLVLMSCVAGALGFSGLLRQELAGVALAAGLLAGLPLWRSLLTRQENGAKASPPINPQSIILICLLTGVILLLTIFALTPPVLFDVTEYHLGAWTDYTGDNAARFIPMPHNFYARFPFPVEAVYFFGLALDPNCDTAPKVFNLLCVLACGGLAAAFAGRCGLQRSGRLLACLAVLTLPVMHGVAIDAMIDAPVALLVAASVYLCLLAGGRFPSRPQPTPLLAVPALVIFTGAITAKYTTAQVYLLPWLVAAAPCLLQKPWQRTAKFIAIGLAISAVPAALWFGKNIVMYGNALEPFFVNLFRPDDTLAIAREQFVIEAHGPQSFLTAAYWTSLFPRLGEFNWLYLAGCAGWLFVARRAALVHVLVFTAISWMLWNLVRESQDRFLLPAMVLVTTCAIVGMAALPRPSMRRVATSAVIFFVSVQMFVLLLKVRESGAITYALEFSRTSRTTPATSDDPTPRETFLETNLGHLGETLTSIRKTLPHDAKLLMIYEARPYLFQHPTAYNTVWDGAVLLDLIRDTKSIDEARAAIAAAGYTHVLVNRQELYRYIRFYTHRDQMLRLGVRTSDDPAGAWSLTQTPSDLYPPFYMDPDWQRLRPLVHELLDQWDNGTVIRHGVAAPGASMKALDVTVAPIN